MLESQRHLIERTAGVRHGTHRAPRPGVESSGPARSVAAPRGSRSDEVLIGDTAPEGWHRMGLELRPGPLESGLTGGRSV